MTMTRRTLESHYLLFDARCSTCTNLASEAGRLSDHVWLRSLHDVDMQALLTRAKPGWRWEPTLLVIRPDKRIAVATGLALRARMLGLLGAHNSWKLWRRARDLGATKVQPLAREGAPPPCASCGENWTRDTDAVEATATVLASALFASHAERLLDTHPIDAWLDGPNRHVVIFPIAADSCGGEAMMAFTVDADHRVTINEIRVDVTGDGWKIANLSTAAMNSGPSECTSAAFPPPVAKVTA